MQTITVCVDYDDILEITMRWNYPIFKERPIVVTTPSLSKDGDPQKKLVELCNDWNIDLVRTNAFFTDAQGQKNESAFNKGAAINYVLSKIDRTEIAVEDGWIMILDADILLPRAFPWSSFKDENENKDWLYGLRRRQCDVNQYGHYDLNVLYCESTWRNNCELVRDRELAGYCHIFHLKGDAIDKASTWYPTGWLHAGGCDSEFEKRFGENKMYIADLDEGREMECLHLGPRGLNWCGRISNFVDGRPDILPEVLDERQTRMMNRRVSMNLPK